MVTGKVLARNSSVRGPPASVAVKTSTCSVGLAGRIAVSGVLGAGAIEAIGVTRAAPVPLGRSASHG